MPQEKSLSACCTIEDGKGNLAGGWVSKSTASWDSSANKFTCVFQWFECFCIIVCGE